MFPGCLYKVENHLPHIDTVLPVGHPGESTEAHLRGDGDPLDCLQLFVVPDTADGFDALNQVLLNSQRDVNQEELVPRAGGECEDIAVSGLIGNDHLPEEKAGVCQLLPEISVD